MVRQISIQDWPLGLEQDIAFLSIDPKEIRRRSNIRFEIASDNLDEFQGAVVRSDSGKFFALQGYRNSPVRGTKLILMNGSQEGIREAIDLMKLRRSDVSWVVPEAKDAIDKAFRSRFMDLWIDTHSTSRKGAALRKRLFSGFGQEMPRRLRLAA
jgi:hypothetical protein